MGKSPQLLWLIAILTNLVFFGAGCQFFAPHQFKGTVLDPPAAIPDFELNDTNQQPFHLSDIEGDIALVYFGYTYCPDVCPLTMWDVKEALAELEGKDKISVIFVSVDPERDTPEVLARYLQPFGPEFIGLTDDFEKVQMVMKPFGAFAEKEAVNDAATGYLMGHTARLFLVTPDRKLMLMYPNGFEPEDLRTDLTYLLQQQSS
jgi:protein SCO1/2